MDINKDIFLKAFLHCSFIWLGFDGNCWEHLIDFHRHFIDAGVLGLLFSLKFCIYARWQLGLTLTLVPLRAYIIGRKYYKFWANEARFIRWLLRQAAGTDASWVAKQQTLSTFNHPKHSVTHYNWLPPYDRTRPFHENTHKKAQFHVITLVPAEPSSSSFFYCNFFVIKRKCS